MASSCYRVPLSPLPPRPPLPSHPPQVYIYYITRTSPLPTTDCQHRRPSHPRRFLASSPRRTSPLSLWTSRLRHAAPLLGARPHLDVRLFAVDASADPAGGVETVPVSVAHELLKAGHRYLDVRTPEEFKGGHPVAATNIPYMFKSLTGMQKNPNFLAEVSSTFQKDERLIVGCQSGKRSSMAANDLISAGFTAIIDVSGGFSAWRQDGLPTE